MTKWRFERKGGRAFFCNEVEIVGYGPRRSSDLSEGGMFIESIAGYPIGTVLRLRFKLQEDDPSPIDVQARVQYAVNGIGVGLEFLDLPAEARSKIAKVVAG